MGRVVAILLLSLPLTAFGQTTTPQNTTTIPAHVNLEPAPAVLYGTGSVINAVSQPPGPGAPTGAGDYLVATPLIPSGPPANIVVPNPTPTTPSAAAAAANTGGISYASEIAPAAGSSASVADAAAQYRSNKGGMKSRVIDNNSLNTLDKNPTGLTTANELTMPQGDVSPEEAAELRNAKPTYAAAGDTLDPRDLAAVEAAVRRSQNAQAAGQEPATAPDSSATTAAKPEASARYEQMSSEAESQVGAQESWRAEQRPARAENSREESREQLPESSTGLPLLAFLGFVALTGGAVSVLRSRA
ncbi:MAG TPA: hypothetical protein VMZ25_09970 [Terriglobales bacterium]|nr:hypothetical protein [Terriglobales bacterium]